MNTKLTINLRDGILDVEGGEEFGSVKFTRILRSGLLKLQPFKKLFRSNSNMKRIRILSKIRRGIPSLDERYSEGKKARVGEYKPTFNSKLNLEGLDSFYEKFQPANHSDKILCSQSFCATA